MNYKQHKLIEVHSGGQYGADIAGLAAARDMGIKTGGWAPKGWKTRYGPRPELCKLGLIEHTSSRYQPRTYANVRDTQATIILAYDFNSPGTICTKKAINFYNKPSFDCDLNDLPFLFDVVEWIDKNKIEVLNVAGNCGKTKIQSSKIFQVSRKYLSCVFRAYKED